MAYPPVAMIAFPATELPKVRMYLPLSGFAASVMPPDCATMLPSGRTIAHFAAVPDGPGGP